MSDKGTAVLAPGAGWDGPLGEANLGLGNVQPSSQGLREAGPDSWGG